MTMKKVLFLLGFLSLSLGAGYRAFAASPVDIPDNWNLQSIATNGKDYAFNFTDSTKAADAVYLRVNEKLLGPYDGISRLGWSPDGSTLG